MCSAELHQKVATELDKIRRDPVMGLVMTRNKVGREEWTIEALIVVLEQFLVNYKPSNW